MLKMPQGLDPNAGHGKPLSQMRAHRCDAFAGWREEAIKINGIFAGDGATNDN